MKINKKKLFGILKSTSYSLFMLFFAMSLFNLGATYGKYAVDNENVLSFATKEREFKYSQLQAPPQELLDHLEGYNKIKHNILWAVFFSCLTIFFDYFIDPDNHFVTHLRRKIGNLKND
jgi:hypothetical protein